MADIQRDFLDPMIEFYGKNPFPPGIARKLQTYGEGMSDEALRAVAEKLTSDHSRPPNLKQMMQALSQAETMASLSMASLPVYSKHYRQQQDQIERAERRKAAFICRCDLGRKADREGWLRALFDYALDYGRLPDERDQIRCRKLAEQSTQAVMRHQGLPTFKSKVRERVNFLDAISREVFGEEAIQHDLGGIKPPPSGPIVDGRQEAAGEDAFKRIKAEENLTRLRAEPLPTSLSELAKKAFGIPTK